MSQNRTVEARGAILSGRSLRSVVALMLLGLCAGCAIPLHDLDRVVLVHKDGYAMDTNRERIVPAGTPPEEAVDLFSKGDWGTRILRSIDKQAETLPAGGRIRLLIFVHGGLNTYQGAMERVAAMLEAVRTATDPESGGKLTALPRYYPIFINWDSDLWESIYDDVFELRFGERQGWRQFKNGYLTALPEAGARFGQGISNAPTALGLEVVGLRNGLDKKIDDTQWPYCRTPSMVTPSNEWRWSDVSRALNAFVFTVFYPTRVLSAPAIQGFGAPAWDIMKRRAELVMAPPGQVTKRDPHEVGGGRLLIKTLLTRIERVEGGSVWKWTDSSRNLRTTPLEITVVGHSMGTMVVNHLLETLPEFPVGRIVYLAAADSIHHVYGAIVPYLSRNPNAEFWSFSLAETREALETDIEGLDVYARGSLLVWIDHFFQRINAPSDRSFGRASNLRQYVQVPPGLGGAGVQRQRFFLVKFGRTECDPPKGVECDPAKHGDLGKVRYLDVALQTVESGVCHR